MEYQAPSVSFTRNELSNSHSFSAKSMYDGVFGAPSKFGVPTFSARVDEYRDIFTGSEASGGSSIPILDIPELNERKISVDDRSSKVDYTDIFGGFADSDFAEPYEQIFVDPKKNENVPEEASGKPTEKVSTSEVFGTYSEGNHGFPLETYEKPLNDIKKFNMSYHKVNNRKNDGTNGTTHVAHLHAVPGYTCVFDEVAPLPVNKGNKFVSSDINDSCPSNNLREEVVIGNHIRKTMADFPTSVTSNGTSVKLFDTHENAHGTHQPEVSTPSSLDNNSGSSEQPMASRFWKTNTDTFEGSNIYCSPSFDEEVDKNSFAATSVAALRKAIEEAQAKIKIAKELKGRKTIGLQHRVKLSFKGGIKDDEEKNGQFVDEVNISRIKKAHESHEEMDALSHTSAGMTNHNLIGLDQVTLGIKPQEKISHAKEVEREILGKNFISVRMDHRQEEAEISEAEEQFFEVYNTGEEWATEFKEAKNENRMTQSVGEHKQMEKGTLNETYEKPEQDAEKLKPAVAELAEVEQFFEVSDTGEDWPATFEFKEAENANNLISEDKLEENRNMDEISKKPKQRDGELKPVEVDGNSEGTERKIRVCDETRVPLNYEEQSSKLRSDVHIINQEIVDSRIQVAQVHEETEKIEPVHGRDKYEEKSRDKQEPMKHDERLGTQRMEELEFSMRQSAVLTSVEKEKEVEEACKLEGYKKEQNDAHWVENVENNFEKGSRPETIEATLYDINSAGETEKIPGDDSASEENEKLHEDVSEEKMFMVDDYQTKDYHKIQEKTGQWVEDGTMETNIVVSAGCEETIKENREDLLDENGLEATEDLYGQYESDSLNIIPKSIVIGFHGSMDSSPEVPACEETKYIKEGSKSSLELEEKGMELEPVEENNEVEEREILETDGLPQGFKLSEILKQMEDTMGPSFWGIPGMNLGGADVNYVENLKYKHAWEFETVCSSGNGREESAPELEVKGVIKENEEDVGFDVKAHHLSDVSERKGENLGLEQPMEAGTSTEKYREEEEEIPISQSAENNEESQQETDSSPSSENNEESQQETDSSPSSENNEDEFDKMLTSQVMETSEEYHQESLASQNAKPAEEIYQTTLIAEEIECNDSFQKESELEKEEPQRKTDEKNERERDKEKEKKAVERAIREARERAFSEARERAAVERAAAKSHQRERLGKTSIESNNKSLSEKAKLKAERAAVERVLAEARERALEKAMSFKSSPRATKHAERFVDEKKSGAFRDTGIKRSASSVDPQDKGSCSSNHNERFDGANGESAPRCKARFERQQRTAERAAKALAEKNMRDLLVQREQAERNRLAEIIDAEVKRWSSGKEGNIRALLSTLQYILGPGSGWQPIPLTDVITTVAVKKAYRRATLSVHPDKLQQRGASIQQKYICEKVFDLLKDAWNRFNVEER